MLSMNVHRNTQAKWTTLLLIVAVACPAIGLSQERWFQIEVSIFSNESLSDRAEESWIPRERQLAYPDGMQRLRSLLDILTIDSLAPDASLNSDEENPGNLETNQDREDRLRKERIAQVGPFIPDSARASEFKFFDFLRDSFLQLPPAQSDFQQTNRALDRSPDHRLLFHGLWRQPVENEADAIPIRVTGGQIFGQSHELEGSLVIRFNDNRDRVVIDADIWLTEYSTVPLSNSSWELPEPPEDFTEPETSQTDQRFYPVQVYHMNQSREMRSTEFHYLDNPALGIVVMVEPYELPVRAAQGFDSINNTQQIFETQILDIRYQH